MLPWQHATTHKVGGSKILIILIEMAANYFGDTAKTDTKNVCTTQNSMNQLAVLHRRKKKERYTMFCSQMECINSLHTLCTFSLDFVYSECHLAEVGQPFIVTSLVHNLYTTVNLHTHLAVIRPLAHPVYPCLLCF